ncbi:hypothetical protein MOQ_009729 [Trypanosoma cruzi marinkellei]|uniref:Uncharacterized protein n=1 Tax=Trypanosoma cruzi marinkellei TaxID=85056 RepID=K2LUY4_TRYCR|nr:hypothetical protein MOQ_009729 [Trypanosoma cruzi marinkellei]
MDGQNSEEADLSDIFVALKEAAHGQWDADAEELLLKGLMAFQANFSARFSSVREELENLGKDVSTASIQVSNAMNLFVLLAQKQFVQNRVSLEDDDDDDGCDAKSGVVSGETDPGEEKQTSVADKIAEGTEARAKRVYQEAIDLGVRVLEERTIPLFSDGTASDEGATANNDAPEEEDDSIAAHSFSDQYRHRRFMALIGSERFLNDPYGGYFDDGSVCSRRSSPLDHSSESGANQLAVTTEQEPKFNAASVAQSKTAPPPHPTTTTTTGLSKSCESADSSASAE